MTGGERERIAGLLAVLETDAEGVEVGPGDDAAVVRVGDRRLVLTTDSQRAGVHYRSGWLNPRQLGRRAWSVAASDIAAMGADPRWGLAALALPADSDDDWIEEVSAGIAEAAREHGAALVGGDLSRAPVEEIVVSVVGELPGARRPLLRSGARAGHECWILGALGLAAAGRALLERDEAGRDGEEPLISAYRAPRPPFRLAAELAERSLVAAAMDVSDGLGIDLARMCAASDCGASIESSRLAHPELDALAGRLGVDPTAWRVSGGDDYALLCAVEPRRVEALVEAAERHEVEAFRIGAFVAEASAPVLVSGGSRVTLGEGWDPFRSGSRG